MPCRVLLHTLLRVDIWANGNNLEGGGRISGATLIVCAGKYTVYTPSKEGHVHVQQATLIVCAGKYTPSKEGHIHIYMYTCSNIPINQAGTTWGYSSLCIIYANIAIFPPEKRVCCDFGDKNSVFPMFWVLTPAQLIRA